MMVATTGSWCKGSVAIRLSIVFVFFPRHKNHVRKFGTLWRKIVFLFISWKYTTNAIYITTKRKEKGRQERIRKNPYKL